MPERKRVPTLTGAELVTIAVMLAGGLVLTVFVVGRLLDAEGAQLFGRSGRAADPDANGTASQNRDGSTTIVVDGGTPGSSP